MCTCMSEMQQLNREGPTSYNTNPEVKSTEAPPQPTYRRRWIWWTALGVILILFVAVMCHYKYSATYHHHHHHDGTHVHKEKPTTQRAKLAEDKDDEEPAHFPFSVLPKEISSWEFQLNLKDLTEETLSHTWNKALTALQQVCPELTVDYSTMVKTFTMYEHYKVDPLPGSALSLIKVSTVYKTEPKIPKEGATSVAFKLSMLDSPEIPKFQSSDPRVILKLENDVHATKDHVAYTIQRANLRNTTVHFSKLSDLNEMMGGDLAAYLKVDPTHRVRRTFVVPKVLSEEVEASIRTTNARGQSITIPCSVDVKYESRGAKSKHEMSVRVLRSDVPDDETLKVVLGKVSDAFDKLHRSNLGRSSKRKK